MTRPRLLDLFCGAGGCAVGYHRAGFDVVGVDIEPQPRYPFEFHRADALSILRGMADYPTFSGEMWRPGYFAAIHASPPCQAYSVSTPAWRREQHPDQIAPVRTALLAAGVPWVIENVPGAPLRPDLKLCGCMFDLPRLKRERWFETSWRAMQLRPPCSHQRGGSITVSGGGNSTGTFKTNLAGMQAAMGIDWMDRRHLVQAIPPAYTEHIGRQLLGYLAEGGEAARVLPHVKSFWSPHVDPVLPGGGPGIDGVADIEPLGVDLVHAVGERRTGPGCPSFS